LTPSGNIYGQKNSTPPSAEWGTTLDDFKKSLSGDMNVVQFTPKDQPGYKNKILNFITAIDDSYITKTIILRINTVPRTDYLFVKEKLYTKLEDWLVADKKLQDSIYNRLKSIYGEPSIQKDGNFYIYSFNSKDTKVLFYKLVYADGNAKCKVYYYTSKLFKMLIMD
jgi:hypothetical protein